MLLAKQKSVGSTCRPRKSRLLNSSVKSLSLRIVTCRGENSGISTSAAHNSSVCVLEYDLPQAQIFAFKQQESSMGVGRLDLKHE